MSDPIPFAIIGTSWITHDYIKCAHATGKFVLAGVYSRSLDSARKFADDVQGLPSGSSPIATYDDLEVLANDDDIKAVYIASPNSLHYEQTKQMLEAGKDVILEKPSTCTSQELDELFKIAYEKKLILVEAWRHIHERNFLALKSALPGLGPILGASLNFCQFSSRYDKVLQGETPNVFNLDFGAGALTDLGCYCVAFAVELFGEPTKGAEYHPSIIATGADGGGTMLMHYDNFTVTIIFSKMFYSPSPTEIFGEKGTLVIPTITDIESVTLIDPRQKGEGREKQIGGKWEYKDFNLQEEAAVHGDLIMGRDGEAMGRFERHSRSVLRVTEKVRRDNGLLFPVERK